MTKKILLLYLFTYLGTNASSQVNLDVNLISSTFYRDRIILKPEVNLNKWSIFISGGAGGRTVNTEHFSYLKSHGLSPYTYYDDSIIHSMMSNSVYRYLNLDIGGSYHYSIFKNNFYYSGASVGLCMEEKRTNYTKTTYYAYEGSTAFFPQYSSSITYPIVEESGSRYQRDDIAWRINFFTGIDIPIQKHLSINVELNAGFMASDQEVDDFWIFNFVPNVQGGLTYIISNNNKKGDQ